MSTVDAVDMMDMVDECQGRDMAGGLGGTQPFLDLVAQARCPGFGAQCGFVLSFHGTCHSIFLSLLFSLCNMQGKTPCFPVWAHLMSK